MALPLRFLSFLSGNKSRQKCLGAPQWLSIRTSAHRAAKNSRTRTMAAEIRAIRREYTTDRGGRKRSSPVIGADHITIISAVGLTSVRPKQSLLFCRFFKSHDGDFFSMDGSGYSLLF